MLSSATGHQVPAHVQPIQGCSCTGSTNPFFLTRADAGNVDHRGGRGGTKVRDGSLDHVGVAHDVGAEDPRGRAMRLGGELKTEVTAHTRPAQPARALTAPNLRP